MTAPFSIAFESNRPMRPHTSLRVVIAVLSIFAYATSVGAVTVTLTFDTVSNTNAFVVTNTDGSTYLNELTLGVGPTPVSGVGQSAIGNGSWQSAAVGGLNHLTVYGLNTGSGGINEAAFTGYNAGTANIRLRDIESFSFETNKPSGTADWYVQLYTLPDIAGGFDSGFSGFNGPNGDDAATWYGRRLTFEPAYAHNPNAPNFFWNEFSTNGSPNTLGFFDSNGPAGTFHGYSGGPTLIDLQNGPINWADGSEGDQWPISGFSKGNSDSSAVVDYRDEILMLLRVNIGSPNNTPSLVDNFRFTLKSSFDPGADPNLVPGQTVIIDFEDPNYVAPPPPPAPPIPEPNTLTLLALGFSAFLSARRRAGKR